VQNRRNIQLNPFKTTSNGGFMKIVRRFTANAAAFLALSLLILTVSTIDSHAQANRQVTAIERRIQTMDQQSKQYEIDNMGREDKKPKVDAARARQIKSEIEEDLKNLQSLYNKIVLLLQDKSELPEWYFHTRRNEARQMVTRLERNLAFTKPSDEIESPPRVLNADTDRKMLRTLATYIYDLITNPVFESTAGLDINQAAKAAQQLDVLLEFTAPGNALYGPLKFATFFQADAIRDPKDVERFEQNALSILKKNCNVDFIDDGTNYRALRMIGVRESTIAEIDKCRSPERNAIIVNRRASSPPEKLAEEEMVVLTDLIQIFSRWKDLAGRKRLVEIGGEFLRRWEFDPGCKEMVDWLKTRLPKEEKEIRAMEAAVKNRPD
jgi:hypothetical protein